MTDFTIRPPRPDESAAMLAVLNAHALAAHGVEEMSESELRRWFTSPTIDVERDVRVCDRGGELTAYADVGDESEEHIRYWLDLRCDAARAQPEELAALIAWAEERARSDAKPGAGFRGFVDSADTTVTRALEEAGLQLLRHSFRMEIDLDDQRAEPRWPDGIAVRTFEDDDARTIYEVQQETFEDALEHIPSPYEEWAHWSLHADNFDPTLWFIAQEGDEIAGIELCYQDEAQPDRGWVGILGVRRPWRRRGVGRALLEHAFAEFARRGYRRVGLGVDADSPTGATRLYESAGMRVVRRNDIYEKPL